MEEVAHDTEKNTEDVHDFTLKHDKDSLKDHFTQTTLGNNTSDMKSNIKTVAILGDSMMKHMNGLEIAKKLHQRIRFI